MQLTSLTKQEVTGMAIGDGVRRNVARISAEERYRLIYAFLALDTSKIYPDGVTYSLLSAK
jgi:hypothetical protein